MKTVVHTADSRGGGEYGWLKTKHSFSFANWYEPTRMGFGALRVLNDDWIASHKGFGMHHHDNFEIITIVMKGVVSHEDSLGNKKKVRAGEVQVMSAGTGVTHAEHNAEDEPLELFQIWIETNKRNAEPRYDQKEFGSKEKNKLTLLVSGDGGGGSLMIRQDAKIFIADIEKGKAIDYVPSQNKGVYLFVVGGRVAIGGTVLSSRDAVGISGASTIEVLAEEESQVLFIEVPIQ